MVKSTYIRLGLIAAIAVIAFLIALPGTPININTKYLTLNTQLGGYFINLFNGKFRLDFRKYRTGLDISGGIRVVLKADMSKLAQDNRDNALESAKEVISRRVNLLGVSEPYITTSKVADDYRIVVEIPGVEDTSSAISLIGQTAQLTFKQLAKDKVWDPEKFQEYFFDPEVWEDTGITGGDLVGADVVFAQGGDVKSVNKPQIRLKFTQEGRDKFSEVARKNINKPVALFLDKGGIPLSMPVVSPDLADGLTDDPVISGTFDLDQAKALSVQIRAGALPVPVEVLEQSTVGATLGAESVKKSMFAGAVGLVMLLLFMVYMYGRLGLVADFALVLYVLVTLTVFKVIPVVLTLPGFAGFILSVGMATDANILIFERVKEEILWGKPKNLAISLGFERAWSSIKDSNISSLLTSGVLFYFGSGPVKGFAFTLAIGIAVSLFTSIFVTRLLIEVLYLRSSELSKVGRI